MGLNRYAPSAAWDATTQEVLVAGRAPRCSWGFFVTAGGFFVAAGGFFVAAGGLSRRTKKTTRAGADFMAGFALTATWTSPYCNEFVGLPRWVLCVSPVQKGAWFWLPVAVSPNPAMKMSPVRRDVLCHRLCLRHFLRATNARAAAAKCARFRPIRHGASRAPA